MFFFSSRGTLNVRFMCVCVSRLEVFDNGPLVPHSSLQHTVFSLLLHLGCKEMRFLVNVYHRELCTIAPGLQGNAVSCECPP